MKNISAAFKAHLAQEVTTLATCWRAELTNGTVYGFTDHSRDIFYGGVAYQHASGFSPTAAETSSMLNVDNMEVEAILNNDLIKEEDLNAGLWDYAKVEVFWVNWHDLSMGRLILKTGTIGQVTIKRTSFVAEVRGLTQAYANNFVELTAPMCRARLGDNRCKVDLGPLTATGTVEYVDTLNRTFSDSSLTAPGPQSSVGITDISRALRAVVTTESPHGFRNGQEILISGVTGVVQTGSVDGDGVMQYGTGNSVNGYSYGIADVTDTTFSISVDTRLGSTNPASGPPYADVYSAYVSGGTASPAGQSAYYDYGLVTFTSGLNNGLSMEVKSYVPGYVELQLPMPYPVAVGDTYTIQPGCGKRLVDDCANKFNNVINFRGEPYLPGFDQATTYASHGSALADGTAAIITGSGGSTGGTGGTGPLVGTGWTPNWITTNTGSQTPDTKTIYALQITVGDVWYATGNPSDPWTTDSGMGTLSHITIRKQYSAYNSAFNVGDVIPIASIPYGLVTPPTKTWDSPLGVSHSESISEGNQWSLTSPPDPETYFRHVVRRVDGETFELWDVELLASDDDLAAYLSMPVDWTAGYVNITAGEAYVPGPYTYTLSYDNPYPMSYGGTVVQAGTNNFGRS